jgi:flagellar hook-basal body complex protein FliE
MDTISPLRLTVPPNQMLPDLGSTKLIRPGELDQLDPGANAATLAPAESATSFQNVLGGFVNEVSQKQAAANDAVNGLLSGQNVGLHQAVISMEEASVSFQMMVEVRNKLLDSYQELMRMQV